jgi:hypothetical protein
MYKFFFYLTNKSTTFDVNDFSSLLHSYVFRSINIIFRVSLCILKLPSLLNLRSCTPTVSLSPPSTFRCYSIIQLIESLRFIYRTGHTAGTVQILLTGHTADTVQILLTGHTADTVQILLTGHTATTHDRHLLRTGCNSDRR